MTFTNKNVLLLNNLKKIVIAF